MIDFFIAGGGMLFLCFAVYGTLNKEGNTLINRVFSLALLARFFQLFVFYLTRNHDTETLYWFYPFNTVMQVLSPVCIYIYVYCFVFDKDRLKPVGYLHFLIPAMFVADIFLWFSAPKEATLASLQRMADNGQFFNSQEFSILDTSVHHLFRRAMSIGYLIAIWAVLIRGFKEAVWTIQKKWVYFISISMTINQMLLLAQLLVVFQNGSIVESGQNQYMFIIPFQIILMMILFGVLFYEPRLLYGQLLISERWTKPVHIEELQEPAPAEEITRRSPMDDEKVQHYLETMRELMEKKQPFLNTDYQISSLSGDLGIPVHHCSYVLNYHMGKGFRDWVNGYRVRHFLQQLPRKSGTKTIEAIAMESGFKNVTTFYNAFKKEKGQLPGDYIKERL
jgi:AraC-like DNA-binding protein